MGWIVALSTLIPLGVGVLLDRRLGTAPLFIIIGAAIGILVSTIGAVRVATRTIDAIGRGSTTSQPTVPHPTGSHTPEYEDEKED